MVNLMSADVNQVITYFYPFLNQLIVAPAILIAAVVSILQLLDLWNTP